MMRATLFSSFNPSRLTLARKRRSLNKKKLAELLGVDVRSITGYESGEFAPDDENVAKLARLLGFPEAFFYADDVEELTPDVASFRALTRMSAGQRDSALGSGAIALQLNASIERRFELPKAQLPDLSREGGPEAAAMALREQWGLGELPVKNMIHLAESRGVRVYSLCIDAAEVDAFSMWQQDTPFMFLNTQKSAEHSRFDAAHELGHLVMHRHGIPQGREAEHQANAFASAFLMPKASVLAHAPRLASLEHLVALKKIWNVSVAALTYRLHALDVLSDWQYQSLYVELSTKGYRKNEPGPSPRETSQILAKVFAALRQENVTRSDIADELCVHVEELDQLVFGLALTGIAGGAPGKSATARRGQLQVVRSK